MSASSDARRWQDIASLLDRARDRLSDDRRGGLGEAQELITQALDLGDRLDPSLRDLMGDVGWRAFDASALDRWLVAALARIRDHRTLLLDDRSRSPRFEEEALSRGLDGDDDDFERGSAPPRRGFEIAPAESVELVDFPAQSAPPPVPLPGGIPAAVAPTAAEPIERTPHLDVTPGEPLVPGARVTVEVYADREAFRSGESGGNVRVETTADEVEIEVWLTVSAHFEIVGDDTQTLTLFRHQDRSTTARFEVSVKADLNGLPPTARMTAHLSHQALPCGHVSRALTTSNAAAVPEAEAEPPPVIQVDERAKAADMIVRIVAEPGDPTGQKFLCHVTSRGQGTKGGWVVPRKMADFVAGCFSEFVRSGTTEKARRAALRGAGVQLFEASPQVFRDAFWAAFDADELPATIAVLSADPYFPWELAVPERPELERQQALGVRFRLSRWTARDGVHAAQAVTIDSSCVVAPRDSGLQKAEAEVETVMKHFAPTRRVDPATFDELDTALGAAPPGLLHFVCHGESLDTGGQVLKLEKKEQLSTTALRGMEELPDAIKARHPLVFLNACKVGRLEPALVGAGGFAEQFMFLGASAVIAPLWSVKDSVAHAVAEEFYRRCKKEPFAEILRDLRSRSYQKPVEEGSLLGEDSWAAYCFYGDPHARYEPPEDEP